MKKEFCSQSDPPGEEVARKFLGAQKLKKYRIRSEQVNECNGSKILPKCSQVEPKPLDRWFARWKAVIYTSSLSQGH